jgi:protein-S-isoprenylcysteine O-methyltransferase Ste14
VPVPQRYWPVVRTSLFAAIFIAFFVVYLPWAWAIRSHPVRYAGMGSLRLLAVVLLLLGAYVALRCVFGFAWTGLGTPAPFDPPRKLVVSGFYRYVRNPMYIGAMLFVIGEAALLGSVLIGLAYALIFGVCAGLFVLLYEEPTLRTKFGADYEAYCRNVPRFIPRLKPWSGVQESPDNSS